MISAQIFLAQLPIPVPTSKVPRFLLSDVFLIIAGAAVLFGLAVAWLVYVRGPKSDISPARRVYKGHPAPPPVEVKEAEGEKQSRRNRKKKRTRRREHRARNATLSETGGLPPPKGPEAPLIP